MASLKMNVIWAFTANGITSVFSWLMLLVLTKIGSPADVGLFALSQAVALPIQMFFTFKLRVVQSTDHQGEFTDDEYQNFRILAAVANIVVAAIIGRFLYSGEIYILILIVSLNYSFLIYREFYISSLQKYERNDQIALSNIVQGVGSFMLFSAGYWLSGKLWIGLAGILITRMISTLSFDRFLCVKKKLVNTHFFISIKRENIWNKLGRLFHTGLPLGGVALLGTLFTSIPRLLLEEFVSVEAVGYYTVLASLLVLLNLFVTSFSQSLTPRLARLYRGKRDHFIRIFLVIFSATICFSVVCVVLSFFFGKSLLSWLFSEEYAVYSKTFFKLVIANVILVGFSCMNIAISAQRSFSVQLPIYIICAFTIFVSSIILIPKFDINGAVYSYTISNLIGFVLCTWVFISNMRRKYNNDL